MESESLMLPFRPVPPPRVLSVTFRDQRVVLPLPLPLLLREEVPVNEVGQRVRAELVAGGAEVAPDRARSGAAGAFPRARALLPANPADVLEDLPAPHRVVSEGRGPPARGQVRWVGLGVETTLFAGSDEWLIGQALSPRKREERARSQP